MHVKFVYCKLIPIVLLFYAWNICFYLYLQTLVPLIYHNLNCLWPTLFFLNAQMDIPIIQSLRELNTNVARGQETGGSWGRMNVLCAVMLSELF